MITTKKASSVAISATPPASTFKCSKCHRKMSWIHLGEHRLPILKVDTETRLCQSGAVLQDRGPQPTTWKSSPFNDPTRYDALHNTNIPVWTWFLHTSVTYEGDILALWNCMHCLETATARTAIGVTLCTMAAATKCRNIFVGFHNLPQTLVNNNGTSYLDYYWPEC